MGGVIDKKQETLTYRGDKLRERYQFKKIFPYKKIAHEVFDYITFKVGNFFVWTTLGIIVSILVSCVK